MRPWKGTVLLLLFYPLEGLADKPAVKAINGSVFGGYQFERADRASQVATDSFSQSEIVFPTGEVSRWGLGGMATAPLLDWLGGRLLLDGGQNSFDVASDSGFPGSTTNIGGLDAGAILFARNPDFGHLDIGYRYQWEDPSNVDGIHAHSLIVAAGAYFPDLGQGPVDWDFFLSYGRAQIEAPGVTENIDDFTIVALVSWYLSDTIGLAGGVHWLNSNSEFGFSTRDLRGTAELSWLLPPGEHRFVTATLFGRNLFGQNAGRWRKKPSPLLSARTSPLPRQRLRSMPVLGRRAETQLERLIRGFFSAPLLLIVCPNCVVAVNDLCEICNVYGSGLTELGSPQGFVVADELLE